MTDMLEIPEFLRRPVTPEYLAHIKRITARARAPKIKNPPKRVRRSTGLGPAFGARIVQAKGA